MKTDGIETKPNNWPQGARIHLGCGDKKLSGWFNVDGRRTPFVDAVISFYDLHKVPDIQARHIYWSHGPEHVYPDQLAWVFQQLLRILAKGGTLTVATIDLMKIVENRYLASNNGNAWNSALYGECNTNDDICLAHRQCFDVPLLKMYFKQAGFQNIRPWEPEQYPDILAIHDYATSCRLVTVHMEGDA